MINSDQCRAARALLRMRQYHLAELAGVNPLAIRRFEAGRNIGAAAAYAIERALREAGIALIDEGLPSAEALGFGVRFVASNNYNH